MDEPRTDKLQQLLERLGRAIHASVVDSAEVDECLSRLRGDGWNGELLIEAALVGRGGDETRSAGGRLKIRVHRRDRPEYLLSADDARWLVAIGISPTRQRSHPQRPLPPFGPRLLPPAAGD
ncbi:MAG: hypothetical protein PVG53_04650 [Holophagae bacterium]